MNSRTTLIQNVVLDGGKRCNALIEMGRVTGPSGERADAAFVIDGNDLDTAIALYGGSSERPGGSLERLQIGMVADLCLLGAHVSWPEDDPVALTLIGGEVAYARGNTAKSANLYERSAGTASGND